MNGTVGSLVCDTGADVTCLSRAFADKAGLRIQPHLTARYINTPGGRFVSAGTTDINIDVQLLINTEGLLVHWDRHVKLLDVWVVDFGTAPPLDLYVSYPDWSHAPRPDGVVSPLGQLAQLVLNGAKVLDERRVPPPNHQPKEVKVVHSQLRAAADLGAMPGSGPPTDLRQQLLERFPQPFVDSPDTSRLIEGLLARRKIFTELDPAEATTVVEFTLKHEPKPVSFMVRRGRHVTEADYEQQLAQWEQLQLIERVSWDTPAYGFAFLIPKASGGLRLTINPAAINDATEVYAPVGGYMPGSMLREVDRLAGKKVAVSLDLREAFLTLALGEEAKRLSTFTTPIGKFRWNVGWFGWHSFPAVFQTTMMQKVVLPTLDKFPGLAILAWIDDLTLGADTMQELIEGLLFLIDRVLDIGGRLKLTKCTFLTTVIEWCGIEIDLGRNSWRISPERVKSFNDVPIPQDREALQHVLGIMRYYYFGCRDQNLLRGAFAKLGELDKPRVLDIKGLWTSEHTAALRSAMRAITEGTWLQLFNPAEPVYATVDASGLYGYAVSAYQVKAGTGEREPIIFTSAGWAGKQVTWPPQVKEAFARRMAVMVHLRKAFPYARIILLCDNKNLSTDTESADPRVQRYQFDVETAGAVVKYWIPGEWNTIADYGSRSVVPSPAPLTAVQLRDASLFSLVGEEEEALPPATVVPGHISIDPMVEKIAAAQLDADEHERATWTSTHHKLVHIGDATVVLYKNRLVVPRAESAIKTLLMRMAHDDHMHLPGGERTLWSLQHQARVHWIGMDQDVAKYISSCARCQFAKAAPHGPSTAGTLSPTMAPYPHHTWYVDLKGEMPKGGYILVVVDAFSRVTSLRKCDNASSGEIILELLEAAYAFGTFPRVIRSDRGSTFDSAEFRAFCTEHAMQWVPGIPYHHQGQGLVESRIRPLAEALIATLGHKAPGDWNHLKTLPRLEFLINSLFCDGTRGSPYWVLHGREPHTSLSAMADWEAPTLGTKLLGHPALDANTINNIVAEHHTRLNAVQGRASIATCLAQALTKHAFDARHQPGRFSVKDIVLIHNMAPNKMLPHFTGPYTVTSVTRDGNFISVEGWIDPTVKIGPVHVSRVLLFDASRTTRGEIAEFLSGADVYVIAEILGHRRERDGTLSFHLSWRGSPLKTWQPEKGLERHELVNEYRERHGLLTRVATTTPRHGGRPARR